MNGLRLRADKPRRALPNAPQTTGKPSRAAGSKLHHLLKRGVTVAVVSGIAVAGLTAFTASSTNATGVAFADQGLNIASIPAPAATADSPSLSDLASQRNQRLAMAGDQIIDTAQDAALAVRSSSIAGDADAIAAEIERLKNLAKFFWPTAGGVSSPYGMRLHPILRYYRMHDGTDIGGKCGQPIYAAQSGTVTKAAAGGYNGGSGNNIRIDHGDINGVNVQTGYLHMQALEVRAGDKVNKGDRIGTVGNTGLSTACHLHFSAYANGQGTDPMKYIGWNPQANRKGATDTDVDNHGDAEDAPEAENHPEVAGAEA